MYVRTVAILIAYILLSGCAALDHGGQDLCAVSKAVFCPLEVKHEKAEDES